jgi:hypothetical protein
MNGILSTIKVSDILIIFASIIGCFYILVLYDPPPVLNNAVPSIEMNSYPLSPSADENETSPEKKHVDFLKIKKEIVG